MRKIILDRIEELKRKENGFSRSLMKWQSLLSYGTTKAYADEVIFEELNDHELLILFERILIRYYKQM